MNLALTIPAGSNSGVGSVIFQLQDFSPSPIIPQQFVLELYDNVASATVNFVDYTMTTNPSMGIIALPFFKASTATYLLNVYQNDSLITSQSIPDGRFAEIATVPPPGYGFFAYKSPQQMLVLFLASGIVPTGTAPLPNVNAQYRITKLGESINLISITMYLNQNSSKYSAVVDYGVSCTTPIASYTFCYYDMAVVAGSSFGTSSFYSYLEQPVQTKFIPGFLFK